MTRRAIRSAVALLGALIAALCLPGLAAASSGGGSLGPASDSDGSTLDGGAVGSGNVTVNASGDGMTIATRASALLRNGLVVTGSLPPGDAGKAVALELWGSKTNWTWQVVAQTQVQSDGTFMAVWNTNHIGRFAIRAVLGAAGGAVGDASASAGLPTVTVTVYRPSLATLYGPGFYGHRTACGTILRRNSIGLANRTLPCGTPVAIYYQGRTIIVPVIDRGPYAHGADWDLTMATGRALGMTGTSELGAVSLPRSS